jgi:phosphatase NudJ
MFLPHITVACNVAAKGKLLLVEETINQRLTLNQPAGHLELGETLIQAASRELFEETGIKALPDALVAVQQWVAPDNTPFIRFLFSVTLRDCYLATPLDPEINCCHWLTPEQIYASTALRSPLLALSARLWQQKIRHPLTLLAAYGRPFHDA